MAMFDSSDRRLEAEWVRRCGLPRGGQEFHGLVVTRMIVLWLDQPMTPASAVMATKLTKSTVQIRWRRSTRTLLAGDRGDHAGVASIRM